MGVTVTFANGDPLPTEAFEILVFPGGEPHVNVRDPFAVRDREMVVDCRCATMTDLVTAFVAHDALFRMGAENVSLFLPYLPGARQDRTQNGGPLTAKVIAGMINESEFASVVAVDPHSDVMPALIDCFHGIEVGRVIDPAMLAPSNGEGTVGAKPMLIIPDEGAVKRSWPLIQNFGLESLQVIKHRDPLNEKPPTIEILGDMRHVFNDDVPLLIVDDICDGGRTFLGIADAITKIRGNVPHRDLRLWVTHGIFSNEDQFDRMLDAFSMIGFTDSFPSAVLDMNNWGDFNGVSFGHAAKIVVRPVTYQDAVWPR